MKSGRNRGILPRETVGTPTPGAVTVLLRAWSDGDESALDRLLPLVEAELRRLARGYMGRERRGHTLQTTAVVNGDIVTKSIVVMEGARINGGVKMTELVLVGRPEEARDLRENRSTRG